MRYNFFMIILLILAASMYLLQFAAAQSTERCEEKVCHIKITRDGFVPKTLKVTIGSTVIWTSEDENRHTVTSGSPGEIKLPFKSFILNNGDTYEFTFEYAGQYKEGSYKYFDQITQIMRGEIIVEPEEEKPAPPPEIKTIEIAFTNPESGVKKASLTSGNIMNMEIDPEGKSLIISVTTVDVVGQLEITLARSLIDAKTDGKDGKFVVLVDGKGGFYDETLSTPAERTLQIVVPREASEIKIVGTQVTSIPSNIAPVQNSNQTSTDNTSDVEKSIAPQIIEAQGPGKSNNNSSLASDSSWILMLIGGSAAGIIYATVIRKRYAAKKLIEPTVPVAEHKITINIIPRFVTISPGESVTFYAQVFDEDGKEVHDIDLAWSTTVKDAKLVSEGRSAKFTALADASSSDTRLFGVRKGEVIVSHKDTAASAGVEIKEVQ